MGRSEVWVGVGCVGVWKGVGSVWYYIFGCGA